MTVRATLTAALTARGIWLDDTNKIIDRFVASPAGALMAGRLDDHGYDDRLLAVVWIAVRAEALKFIDETCPEAWYRPMFVDDVNQGGVSDERAQNPGVTESGEDAVL